MPLSCGTESAPGAPTVKVLCLSLRDPDSRVPLAPASCCQPVSVKTQHSSLYSVATSINSFKVILGLSPALPALTMHAQHNLQTVLLSLEQVSFREQATGTLQDSLDLVASLAAVSRPVHLP